MKRTLRWTGPIATLALAPAAMAQNGSTEAAAQPESWLDGWVGSVELGLNGASGNTERFNVRAGLNATRDAAKYKSTFGLTYSYGTDDGDESENRLFQLFRNDWKFEDSPWSIFFQETFEIDSFQSWDQRLSMFVGPAYQAIKNETTSLQLRAGIGATKEFGSSRNEWIPEALLGADFAHQIDERQKFTASVDVYPSLSDVGDFRVLAKAAYEILLSKETNMSLKLGIEDRYNTDPGDDNNRNDLTYFALLAWTF